MQLLFLRCSAPVKVLIDKPEGDHRVERFGPGGEEYLLDLGTDPLRGKSRSEGRFLPDCGQGRRFYLKAEAGGEAESAEMAIAFIVKSRRMRSVVRSPTKATLLG